MIPRTIDEYTTELSNALKNNGMNFEVKNITKQTYELLKTKRKAAIIHKDEFENEGHKQWFDLLMMQTEWAEEPYQVFEKAMARYIYIARK